MRLWISGAAIIVYGAIVATILFWPTPVDRGYDGLIKAALSALHERGLPSWYGYPQLEFSANIAMFIPLGFFISFALARRFWWVAIVASAGFSAVAELLQGALLPQRFSSLGDVIANTTGAIIGAALALLIRLLVRARDRRRDRDRDLGLDVD